MVQVVLFMPIVCFTQPLSEDEVRVTPGVAKKAANPVVVAAKQAEEEKELAIMTMTKKKKRVYDRVMHSRQKKSTEVRGCLPFFVILAPCFTSHLLIVDVCFVSGS